MKLIFIICIICLSSLCSSQEAYTDSLAYIPQNTGSLNFWSYPPDPEEVVPITSPGFCDFGDSYLDMNLASGYGYFSFELPIIPDGYHIETVDLKLHIEAMMGNDVWNIYPIFDTPDSSYNPPCLIEHIDYGHDLDPGDIYPIILDTPDTLLTSYYVGLKDYNMKQWLLDDINNNRIYTQYRLRFDPCSDWDSHSDFIHIPTGCTGNNLHYNPYIICIIAPDSTSNNDPTATTPVMSLTNYPNPFNPTTNINFSVQKAGHVDLSIYNIKGQLVRTLENGVKSAGIHEITWDGKDNDGNKLASGIYIYQFNSGNVKQTQKAIMLK